MKIFLAAPCYDARYCGNFLSSLMGLQRLCYQKGIDLHFQQLHFESLITRARDRTVQWFLQSDADVYFSWDTDIGCDPNDILRLCTLPYEVVAGPYPLKGNPKGDLRYVCSDPISGPDENGCVEIMHAGTGFIKFSRSAIQKLVDDVRHEPYKVGSVERDFLFPVFKTPVSGGVLLSEDWHVCHQWRKLGGKVMLDPNIKLSHAGGYTWNGNGYPLNRDNTP